MTKIECMADLFEPSGRDAVEPFQWTFDVQQYALPEIQVMAVVRDALFDRGLEPDERRRVLHWLEEYVAANELL